MDKRIKVLFNMIYNWGRHGVEADENSPAFLHLLSKIKSEEAGVRDHFAGLAMQKVLDNEPIMLNGHVQPDWVKRVAVISYQIADAMLEAKNLINTGE